MIAHKKLWIGVVGFITCTSATVSIKWIMWLIDNDRVHQGWAILLIAQWDFTNQGHIICNKVNECINNPDHSRSSCDCSSSDGVPRVMVLPVFAFVIVMAPNPLQLVNCCLLLSLLLVSLHFDISCCWNCLTAHITFAIASASLACALLLLLAVVASWFLVIFSPVCCCSCCHHLLRVGNCCCHHFPAIFVAVMQTINSSDSSCCQRCCIARFLLLLAMCTCCDAGTNGCCTQPH